MVKKILIYDQNGKARFFKEGDIACVNSGLQNDVYKRTDKQVICNNAKEGDPKRRYGILLKIIDGNTVIICCASSSTSLKFALLDSNKNEKVKFSKRMIVLVNPHTNFLYKDTLVNFNLNDKQIIIDNLKLTWEYKELYHKAFLVPHQNES